MFKVVFVIVTAVVLAGCPNAAQVIEDYEEDDANQESTGSLEVTLASLTAQSFTADEASAEADVYELFALSESNNYSLGFAADELTQTHQLNVLPGDYRVIVLAGDTSVSDPVLIGSGSSSSLVTVESGAQSEVAISIYPYYFEFTSVPESVTVGSTGNSFEYQASSGSDHVTATYNIEFGESTVEAFATASGKATTSSSNSFDAPSSSGTYALAVTAGLWGITLVGPATTIDADTNDGFGYDWESPAIGYLNSESALYSWLSTDVQVTEISGSSGIGATLSWSDR